LKILGNFYQRGGVWVLAQAGFMWAVFLLAMGFRRAPRKNWVIFAGIAFTVVGVALIFAGALALGGNLTPYPKPAKNARLVRHGIFSLVRHPIYTGVMLSALGWAQIWQSWPAILMAFSMIPFFNAKARREEHWLRQRFPQYAHYEQRVKRFVPRIY
jgi:protein-S-isoprenylcysteine O-methyltransferase Ste14